MSHSARFFRNLPSLSNVPYCKAARAVGGSEKIAEEAACILDNGSKSRLGQPFWRSKEFLSVDGMSTEEDIVRLGEVDEVSGDGNNGPSLHQIL